MMPWRDLCDSYLHWHLELLVLVHCWQTFDLCPPA
jgi:hypothetical protein